MTGTPLRHDSPRPTSGSTAAVDGAVDAALRGLEAAVDSVVDAVDTPLSARALADVARRVGRSSARLQGVRAATVAAAERSGAVAAAGATGGAQWLASVTGATPRAAGRAASLGRAMDEVPELGDAIAGGRIDDEQAASLAGAVRRGTLDRDEVATLTREAEQLPAGALAQEVRRRERRADQAQLRRDEQHARRRRRADWRTRADGSIEGEFLLPPVEGQTVTAALEALVRPDPAGTPDALRRTPQQRRADALVDLAQRTVDGGDLGTIRSVKPHVTVVVPVSMLTEDDAEAEAADALGVLGDGTVISAATARRVLCDADVRRIVIDPEGRPLDVGRATRTWSGAQRAASAAIDGGCRGPACDRPFAWTDLHHVRWWRKGGGTALDNGVPLCGHCHDLVHHDGWQLALDTATRHVTWTSPTGDQTVTTPRGPTAPSPVAKSASARPAPDIPSTRAAPPAPAEGSRGEAEDSAATSPVPLTFDFDQDPLDAQAAERAALHRR